jgi:hypothetical protein
MFWLFDFFAYIRNVYIGRNYGLGYLSIYGNYMVKVKGCIKLGLNSFLHRTAVRYPATAIGRGLKPLDAKIDS